MRAISLFIIGLFNIAQVFAQVDLARLQQEYVSRKPDLDSMYAYPNVPFDSLRTLNEEGIGISFWWMPHEKNKGTALLVHGFLMNKSLMLSRAKIYYDLGYNVVLMDLRARGQSSGASTTSGPGISSDVTAVMDYYAKNFNVYGPLILVGYSHGGRAVVFAAEKKPEMVKAVVLESIPYSLAESFRRIYKVDPPPIPEGNITKAFGTISKTPILLMVGSNDTAIIPEEAQKIKDLFANPASQLKIFDGGGHNLMVEKSKPFYMEEVKSFLSIVMKSD